MNLLNGTKCYLAGPIEYADDARGGIIWRNEITPLLHDMGIKVYNPMLKPRWYPDITKTNPNTYVQQVLKDGSTQDEVKNAFDAIKFIENADFRYIYDCEWVIVYLPKTFTVGTIDELRAAVNANKPIFVVSPNLIPASWLMGMVATPSDWRQVFFKDMSSLLEHLKEIDRGNVSLDPLRWIFLSYFRDDLKLTDPATWAVRK